MISASVNPKSNRTGPIITPAMIAEVRRLARGGMPIGAIADHIHWPWHCSLKRLGQWAGKEKP